MPQLFITTNITLDHKKAQEFAGKATAKTAELLNKGVAFVQTLIQPGQILTHGGTTEPAAFVQLKSIGLKEEQCPELSAAICALLRDELGITAERVYVEFVELKRAWFGWNGKTFA